MTYKTLGLCLALALLIMPNLSWAAIGSAVFQINCQQLFMSHFNPYMGSSDNPYVGPFANITDYGSLLEIATLLILIIFMVLGITYAVGYGFNIEVLQTFTKTELAEAIANLAIIGFVGISITFAYPALNFFVNFGSVSQAAPAPTFSNTGELYIGLCQQIDGSIITNGYNNWFGVVEGLFITDMLGAGQPPTGGLTISAMPNDFGIAFTPFQAASVLTQILWDEQITYFGVIFLGMFMVVMLMIIYFLFPLFLYAGIVLRSFPWTRAAGGSLIALFISFYIMFPAMMYPFLSPHASITSQYSGFCTPGSATAAALGSNPSNPSAPSLCNGEFSSFSTTVFSEFLGLFNYDFGAIYYNDISNFIKGLLYVGVSLVGLIIAVIISYEMVEKLGSVLGAPSLQGSRTLSKIL